MFERNIQRIFWSLLDQYYFQTQMFQLFGSVFTVKIFVILSALLVTL